MTVEAYLGIDAGSVTTKFAVLDPGEALLFSLYLPTRGEPLAAVKEGLGLVRKEFSGGLRVLGAAATGSARELAGAVAGADVIKNEITCQALAAVKAAPDVRTVIEIGGQDSKLILVRDGLAADFGMNTVCAAGTGSFLDHQAARLNMSIEEFSRRGEEAEEAVEITGKCTVFAESDMIHRQQTGADTGGIIYGLCRALVRNYLSDVASGKEILPPVVFQGGVAFNRGIIRAFKEELGTDIIVPPHHEVMGAVGAALTAMERAEAHPGPSSFRGFDTTGTDLRIEAFTCRDCPENCAVTQVLEDGKTIASQGGKCDKWHINQAVTGSKIRTHDDCC